MRSTQIKILIGCSIVVALELLWHAALLMQNGLGDALLRFYLYQFPHTRKALSGYLDLGFPAFLLGLFIGRVAWQWPAGKAYLWALAAAVVLAALNPVYGTIIGPSRIWWWPRTSSDLALWFVGNTVMTIFLTLLCTYGGRAWASDLRKP